MVSSDGSFTPPEISAPVLVLRAGYGDGHAVAARMGVGLSDRRRPRGAPRCTQAAAAPGFRDLGAERAILAKTVLAGTGLERLGLLDDSGRPVDAAGVDGRASTACA